MPREWRGMALSLAYAPIDLFIDYDGYCITGAVSVVIIVVTVIINPVSPNML